MRPVVIALIYYIASMLTALVLLDVSRDMKESDATEPASLGSTESVAIKSVAAFAKHHVIVTTCLDLVRTAVESDGRVMIVLMFQKIKKIGSLSFMDLLESFVYR